ncbi:MAG: hypothetical protein EBX36_07490, partial [Planctomycetia bacterium]|nr:hypothetical protein [Planctomycetia bacterium]
MPKTLDDIQTLLTRRGYACKRMVDVIVATTVITKIYKNPAGDNLLEIVLTIDRPNRCVAVEVLRAFELRETAHKAAALACLMTAAGRTPLLRSTLEPEGTVTLRIDCTCGRNGARQGDVLQAVALLESWVEIWFPQVSTAMTHGMFNANEVPHLNLLRMGRSVPTKSVMHRGRAVETATPAGDARDDDDGATAGNAGDNHFETGGGTDGPKPEDRSAASSADGADDAGGSDPKGDDERPPVIGAAMRAAALSERPGAHPHRLRVLFEFFRRLDEENR